jgi:hypothetical protein
MGVVIRCAIGRNSQIRYAQDMSPEDNAPENQPDPSHDLDMVPVFSESGAMAEMEATMIQGVLDANDIPSTVSGDSALPVTEFAVSVPESRFEDAKRAIAEAQAAGPAAAEQGELESVMDAAKGR